ncbi:MAG TPA: biotin transporter BioY [Ktedonobacteraceae bacterium]
MAIAPGTTLADYLVPTRESRTLNLVRDAALIIGFSLFVALCAQVSLQLSFTPVPVTLQTLGVLLTGAALGSKRGGLAMLLYLAEGSAHLPFFAGGTGGFPLFTGGYLFGFVIAAFVVGWLCERGLDRSLFTSAIAMLPGSIIIYLVGAFWLGIALLRNPAVARAFGMSHVTVSGVIALGITPYLIGDLLKLIVAALLLPAAWALVRRVKGTRA